jgi:hypothetical protein
MSKRGWALGLILLCALAAKQPPLECGTYFGRAQAELFLHRRAARSGGTRRSAAAPVHRDVGNIAVIDDSDGVIGRRNRFDLDRRTLIFMPSGPGYTVSLDADTFDTDAASAGAAIAGFSDDDTRSYALPFTFPFFGAAYQQIWVNSNGYLTFGGGDTDASGSYGHLIAGLPAIAPLFTDLDPSQSSDGVHVLSEPGRLVVTFASVPLYNSSDFGIPQIENFQVRLFAGGRIEIAYRATDPPDAVVGITPGGYQTAALVAFSSAPIGTFPSGVAEVFASADALDPVAAAQKFYQTHDDAYDYLVFYNTENVAAGRGIVAYESTVRSSGQGYGDLNHDNGAEYGSPRRLQAVLNLGPLSQYPANPSATVPARGVTGDTPLTILAHETGHLYLALVSAPNPSDPSAAPPMLGRGLVHWAFTFNSEASFLEGNRIADAGAGVSPRFSTTGTVEAYSRLDQYLMGFLPPEEVPPMFAVLGSPQPPTRAPQNGVSFDGNRWDIAIDDVIRAAGRRTPDSTVAQRRFRFAFVLIVPPGTDLSAGGTAAAQIAQVDRYRSEFETLFANATNHRANADTSLKHSVTLSMFPGAGVVAGAAGTASLALASPAESPVTFALQAPAGLVSAPREVVVPAGGTRVSFQVSGVTPGVEEFSAIPSDSSYETAFARVQVADSLASLHLAVSGDNPIVVRVADRNGLPYSNVPVIATASSGASVQPASAVTGDSGAASFVWTPLPGGDDQLTISIAGMPASSVIVTASGVNVLAPPILWRTVD